jgi:AsmA-like C-terminal region
MRSSFALERPYEHRARYWIAGTSLVALTFAIVAVATLVRHWPFSRGKIAESLQEIVPGTVEFAAFQTTYAPHPGCVMEGIVFRRRGVPADGPPLFALRKMRIQATYFDLFFRPGYIARIVLEGLRIHIPPLETLSASESPQRKDLSNTRFGQIVADGAVLEIARKGGKEPLRFVIHTLTLAAVRPDGPAFYRVALHNPLPPGEIVSKGQFGPWSSDGPPETPVSGSYTFEQADLGVFHGIAGLLSSQGEFSGALGRLATQGAVDVPDFSVTRSRHAVRLQTNFRAVVNAMNGDVVLQRVEASFLHTLVTANGQIASEPGERRKTTSLDLAVKDGRIQDVLRLFVKEMHPPLNGTANLRAHVIVPPEGRQFLEEVQLTGNFDVASGHFTKPDTQTKIDQLSDRASPEKRKRDDDPPSVISNLSGHASLQNGAATLSDLSFRVPDALAQMHGTYNLLNQRIDLHGTLKTDAQFTKVTGGGAKSVFLKPFDAIFKRHPRGAVIPVQLTGTYSDPHPGLEIASKSSK